MKQPNGLVAIIREGPKGLEAQGAFTRFKKEFKGSKAAPGDLFIIDEKAQPLRRLGRPSSVHAVIEALLYEHGEHEYPSDFPIELPKDTKEPERRDLTDLPTFTIDGESTKDFDDAISARFEGAEKDKIRVWVHVADVSYFIKPGSRLDKEARRRGTSIYLPTRTIPMLPPELSNGLCSLVPGELRKAVTVELLLQKGKVIEKKFYRSTIKSIARLTYDQVDQIFLGRLEPGPTYAAALKAAREAAVLQDREVAEHGSEPIFHLEQGEVINISERVEGESHYLIERLMVLANQEVAEFLSSRNTPTLFRTHELTSKEREGELIARLKSLGFKPKASNLEAAKKCIEKAPADQQPLLEGLLMRSRVAAEYTKDLSPHQGLNIPHYCHFTSPIRRYADLMVHRALLSELGLELAPRFFELDKLAEHLNERMKISRKLERRAESICRISYLRTLLKSGLSRNLEGVITGMGSAGLFIDFGISEGLLPAREIKGDPNPEETIWKTKKEYKLGDKIKVNINSLDPVKGQVSLKLASNQEL